MESIVLGGGCFWCVEAAYLMIKGVSSAVSGYAGGSEKDAEYYTVGSGTTGHAEVVQVTFDPAIISLADIFEIFFTIHNPTTKDRQGNDVGPQYRSVIFYANDAQRQAAVTAVTAVQPLWDEPIVTEIAPLQAFYKAEDYHQNYFAQNPEQGYCQVIINPKLQKLRQKFAARIKDKA